MKWREIIEGLNAITDNAASWTPEQIQQHAQAIAVGVDALRMAHDEPMECFECGGQIEWVCKYCWMEPRKMESASNGIKLREVRAWHMAVTEKDVAGECVAESGECSLCGILDCPYDDPLHYHHDGCPSEYCQEQQERGRQSW